MVLNWMNLVTESQPLVPIPLSRKNLWKVLPPPLLPRSRTSDRSHLRSRMAIIPAPHPLHPPLRSHGIHLMVHLEQHRSPPKITVLWKRRTITVVAASVLSCNFRFHSFTFPRTVLLSIFPRRQGLSRTFSLHLFGSSAACCSFTSTFRHALPSEDVLYLG